MIQKWVQVVGWTIIFGVPTFIAIAALAASVRHSNQEYADRLMAACHSHGWLSAEETEHHGKTSVTSHFCVGGDGRVYWPGSGE